MAKKAILVICVILVSSMFLGCVDIKSIGGGIGGTTDPVAEYGKSGIFSEDVTGDTWTKNMGGYNVLCGYKAVYNNGNTIDIGYESEPCKGMTIAEQYTEEVTWVRISTKEINGVKESYGVILENEKPTEYWYHYTNYGEEYAIRGEIYWDDAGRVDPRSDGDIDRANKFIEAGLKKGKQVKERFYAKELGDWN